MRNFTSYITNFFRNSEISFQTHGKLTLGVEIELQIIDPKSLSLTPRAEEVLKSASSITKKIKPELFLNMIEINSDKCFDVHEVAKDLNESFDLINKITTLRDISLATTGCHPFSKYANCILTKSGRYHKLMDRNQWLSRRMSVYGLHVHIGMKNGDDAIRFNNFFLNLIPHLLALSASSPFWQGDDTGLASCRPTTYEALPTAGHPYHVKNWREFEQLYYTLKKCQAINSIKDLWWDIRPSPHYGTLEIRTCDVPATLAETLGIVAFIHLLAYWFDNNGRWLEQIPFSPMWFVRENKWRAIRYGLDADLIVNLEGKTKPIVKDISDWLKKLEPYTKKLGYEKYIAVLQEIITKGNSSMRQRKTYAESGLLNEVVKFNIAEFLNRSPIYK